MSKKNRRQFNQSYAGSSPSTDLAEEYRIIRFDLIRVIVLNIIFLAAILTLYYTNLQSGYLERWFGKIINL